MDVFVGIDGGGTKTRAMAVTKDGRLLVDLTAEGSNVNRYGWEPTQRSLSDLFGKIRAVLKEDEAVVSVYLGLAGIDREQERQRMNEWVRSQWPDAHVRVGHDALPALVAASGESKGIVLIAGTGSIAFGVNEAGETCRVGGWGYLIGDEGSGYDIGKRALIAIMRSYDGRGPSTLLTKKILTRYGLQDVPDLIPLVYSECYSRERMAELARVVMDAALEGDLVSSLLLADATVHLCELVEVLLRRLKFESRQIPLVVTGGLFHPGSMLTERIRARLEPEVRVVTSKHPPVVGALLLAQQQSGKIAAEEFQQLIRTLEQ
ncbi:N-acetylglucosamine kinase [Effusibacillus lacus]|uniref:ATPase BadF/BadG/BcrA/BcrD type domain-containing protein n=1 Tax=Effusibacillus lacus TaxID=1348429 RepID=A0A292YTC2_9BACL|nr:BadF/BadG/BcrA/BcrD ATPase family protein [Effusibacillus lacus]TCS75879.1 N-acetylglucosamine kinase-like BadF-type ATPase [Effusibacillus lacus]GAX91730.1 hypothetical protein EFBL_3421 [Effusibacillus lacus]